MSDTSSSKKGLLTTLAVLGVGAIALVVFVLPAEYGIDPTGAGKALGVSDLSDSEEMTELERGALRSGVLTLSEAPYVADPAKASDRWVRELAPFESIEFKYTLSEGEPLEFQWTATAPLTYDMHAHPFEGGEALTESYGQDSAAAMRGTYLPAFTGIHGWFWRNDTTDNVTLTLDASGALTEATVFEGSGQHKRQIGAAEASATP